MKIKNYFMLAAAGLMMMTSCSKEENEGAINGVAALTVNIAAPASRALVPGTQDGTQIDLTYGDEGNVEVKLTADAGGTEWVKVPQGGKYTFYDVVNPTKVEVRINGGVASYENLDDLKALTPANMQAYGSSTEFKFDGTTTNEGKTYDKYITTVTAQIPVGRIEVSGIKHKGHDEGKECVYSKLQIEGLYFDAAATTPNTPADVDFAGATEDLNKATFTGDFLTVPSFPTDDNVAAFNFFPSTAMPVLKMVFTGTTKDGKLSDARRYAVVKAYKANGTPLTAFEAGKVYRITDVTIADDDYTGDESGNTTVAVEVTVAVQQWTMVDTTVEF
ncbi:hypothetical protein [uncultured Bacteroides sp.]|uniref:hypothetical protein n=1 Tax=uncultured Bacteroides sp. TaxID=162156 RepID=UPI002628BC74|nr:hypothetical protein [uncultured Bacteroides sp.]